MHINIFRKNQKKFVAISLEEGLAKIAYVSLQEGQLIINNTYALSDLELDNFLKTTKEQNFIVVSTFRTFYQEIFSLPPAQDKYIQKLAEIELRKNYTEVKEFSFLYYVLGETQHEGRKIKNTFVFAVDYEEIRGIIERFSKYNKTIIALYPSMLTLSTMLSSTDNAGDDVLLCILDTGNNKILFLLKDGKTCFVRVTQSDQPGINEPDIDNINMSINYCRQTLRMSPSKVIFIGTTGCSYESIPGIIVPSMNIEYPSQVIDRTESISEYIVPLSAIFAHKNIRRYSLLPPAYRTMNTQKAVLTWSTSFLLLFSLLGAGRIALTVSEIPDLRTKIHNLRKEISEREPVFVEYGSYKNELQKIMPLVTYMNRANTSPDVQKVLAAFSFLPMQNIKINSIQMNIQDNKLMIHIQGVVLANSFADMDTNYSTLINLIKNTGSMDIVKHAIDVKEMVFSIEAKWKT
jgi:hypothetical protein